MPEETLDSNKIKQMCSAFHPHCDRCPLGLSCDKKRGSDGLPGLIAPENEVRDILDKIVGVKLITKEFVFVKTSRVVGECRYALHPGKLTQTLLQQHECLQKQCPFLKKYQEHQYWQARENAKKKKREKKEQRDKYVRESPLCAEIRNTLQEHSDRVSEGMLILHVYETDKNCFTILYVSDNTYADSHMFPETFACFTRKYPGKRAFFKHVKDEEGHFATTHQYLNRPNRQ